MTRDQALSILRANRAEIESFGVRSIALFGSVARDEATADSDIDILVEFKPEERVGIFRFLDLKQYSESILGRSVDLVTRAALRPELRERILKDAIDAAA